MLAIEVNHKWDACSSKNSTQAPVHPHTKLSKYRTRIIWTWWKLAWRYSRVSSGALFLYKSLSRLVLCYKKDWATLLHFIYFCYLLLITIFYITNYLLPLISVLAENTLLKTAYHFLLLLVGFDTLTYQKELPILVGHQGYFLVPLPGSEVPLVSGIW